MDWARETLATMWYLWPTEMSLVMTLATLAATQTRTVVRRLTHCLIHWLYFKANCSSPSEK